MKKFALFLLALIVIIGVGGFIFYKFYLPDMVAEALIKDETPSYVPVAVKNKLEKFKAPMNKASEDVIEQMHKSNLRLDQILKAIDETEEQDVHAALYELNSTEISNTDQAFDLVKKHFRSDFDVEVLREPFKENVNMKMIRKAMYHAESFRTNEAMDVDMAKAVIKKMLVEKEKEFLKR